MNLKSTVNEAFAEIEAAVGMMGYMPLNECVEKIDQAKAKIIKACCEGADRMSTAKKLAKAQNLLAAFLNRTHEQRKPTPIEVREACEIVTEAWAELVRVPDGFEVKGSRQTSDGVEAAFGPKVDAEGLKVLAESETGGTPK